MVKARTYVVKKYFKGLPKRDDFEIVENELPPLKEGQFIVKAEWISVDPYLRAYNSHYAIPYNQYGFQIGPVTESKHADFPVGCKVVSHLGWCDYSLIDEKTLKDESNKIYKLPEMGLPSELGVGALGMHGITAYFGLLEVCKPNPGETVVVTGAAGAVGSIVGQIAKIKGCKVIGFVGSDEKVKWLENELGYDKAINYKSKDVRKALKEAAPKGVDCLFENVGGELSSTIISQMNKGGRVAICGCISVYNQDASDRPKTTSVLPYIVVKELEVKGFHVRNWYSPVNRWPEAIAALVGWIKTGKVQARSHVTEGFDNLYDAFIGMLNGENLGKAVVKV